MASAQVLQLVKRDGRWFVQAESLDEALNAGVGSKPEEDTEKSTP